jgi:uncharacterized membrane protein/YHS domain-containing protein
MKNWIVRILAVYCLWLVLITTSFAQPVNTMCPVTPEEQAEAGITTEYNGETIGFCCKSCLRKFNANPEKYVANLEANSNDFSHGNHSMSSSGINGEATGSNTDHPHASGEHAESSLQVESEGSEGHDHALDHGQKEASSLFDKIFLLLGKLHVLIVHLPIGLLPLAGFFELVSLIGKSKNWAFAARLNFVIGSFAAIVAATLGWIAASQSNYGENLAEILTWHRWFGTTAAAISFIGLVGLFLVRRNSAKGLVTYRISVFILSGLIPATAHFGGSLIYGVNYLF